MTAGDAHRAFIVERWPELHVDTFVPVEGGWECFTYLLNGEWVFQLPRLPGADERLRKQMTVPPELAREVSSAVPVPAYASIDPVCMGYRLIVGRPISATFDGIWPERLGRFLYDLHLTPPEFLGMRSRSAEAARDFDLAWILHAWPNIGARVLGAYGGAPDDRFLTRARFAFMLMPWHEVKYGRQSDLPEFVRSGLAGVRDRLP